MHYLLKGLPGGAVVKNPPANAGDMGSIPDPEDPTPDLKNNNNNKNIDLSELKN